MSEPRLLLVLAAAAVAAMLAVLAARRALAAVPDDDRRWRDRPPRAWRLAWPAVRLAAAALEPWLPVRWRSAHARLLCQAGLDRSLDAAQALAGSAVGAVLAGAVAGGLVAVLPDLAPAWARAPAAVGADGASRWGAWAIAGAALLGAWLPASWLRERRAERLRAIGRALPFFLDVITLSVESGANLTGALQHAVAKGPAGPLRIELERVLRDVRAGRTRVEALRAMAERVELPAVTSWVAALAAAERQGSGLGPILRAQAEQRRQERFQHAEKLAMKAPVKMLFPLLCFVFPCTFVLLFFPIAVRLVEEGLLR
jgi:tight adherence protein C